MLLPAISSIEEYRAIYGDSALWIPAARHLCERHGIDAALLTREGLGSHVVFGAGERVLKMYCPLWPQDFEAERTALTHIHGLPVPRLVAEGRLEGWPYVVMTRIPGRPAVEVWPRLSADHKAVIVGELGVLMRRLHEQPPVRQLSIDWPAFVKERIEGAERHHNLGEPWLGWMRKRLAEFHEPDFTPVLLNADITADHVFLGDEGGSWKVTGLIDFGDAMMGNPLYEFLAPLCFFTTVGVQNFEPPALTRIMIESYGLRLDRDLAERLTTWCLLHRFGRLEQFLDQLAVKDGDEFFKAMWGDL